MNYEYLENEIKNIIEIGIDKKIYMMKMSKLNLIPILGIGLKSSNDKEYWVKCHIDESQYKLSDGYKITIKADDPIYGHEHFYQEDFVSLLKKDIIVDVTGKETKIEHRIKKEPIDGGFFIETEYDVLIVSEEFI